MNRPDNDLELDAWLRRSSSLHEQLARLDRAEPPEELDRLVLERAREAIHTPRADKPLQQTRWTMPVALAATLVLAFTVLLRVTTEVPVTGSASEPRVMSESTQPVTGDTAGRRGANDPALLQKAPPAVLADTPAAAVARQQAPPRTPNIEQESQSSSTAGAPAARRHDETLARAGDRTGVAKGAPPAAAPGSEANPPVALAVQEPVEQRGALEPKAREDADSWLAAIGRLRAAGHESEADREMVLFRKAHPTRAPEAAAAATTPER